LGERERGLDFSAPSPWILAIFHNMALSVSHISNFRFQSPTNSANLGTYLFPLRYLRLQSARRSAYFVPNLASLNKNRKEFESKTTRSRRLQCRASYGTPGSTGALTPELKEALDTFVASNKVVLFMKGTKDFPQCGFSNSLVQILNSLNVEYETVNILENDTLRQGLKVYSSWPTFPQLYIDGEFFGGCDITVEAYQKGELQEFLKAKSS